MIVRLSRGSFPADKMEEVRARLAASLGPLAAALAELRGLLHYYAAVDPVSCTMVNVSLWATLDDARQMETLAAMLALAREFIALGVTFERPILNYETVWELPTGV
jgi:hypothetical protein